MKGAVVKTKRHEVTMLLCPPQIYTSPKRTSCIVAFSLATLEDENWNWKGTRDAAVAGRVCLQVPSELATVVKLSCWHADDSTRAGCVLHCSTFDACMVVVTVAPGVRGS